MSGLIKNKAGLGLILLFIIAMYAYNSFKGNEPVAESAQVAGGDLVKLSDKLQTASLSTELLGMPIYQYLTDFSEPVPEQSLGRPNPFEIIGRD